MNKAERDLLLNLACWQEAHFTELLRKAGIDSILVDMLKEARKNMSDLAEQVRKESQNEQTKEK